MKTLSWFFPFFFMAHLWAADSFTLAQCVDAALVQSESVGLAEEALRRAEATYTELRAAVLPRLGAKGTERIQDTSGVPAGSNSTFTRRERPEASLYARQTVFAGFREFAALKAQDADAAARAGDVAVARWRLREDVARVFYTVVERDLEIQSLETLTALSRDREAELRKRFAIGRSRESELISTEAQIADLEARLVSARGQRDLGLEILRSLTGTDVKTVVDDTPPAGPPGPLEGWLSGLPARPDLRAAQSAAAAETHWAVSARRARWPSVTAEGNYYLKRTGFNEPIDWDVLLTLDAPIFTGGQWTGSVRAAESDRRAAALRLSRARREAEREIRERHRTLSTLLDQAAALARAADLADENHRVQSREYRLGLVTNLDVLSAMNNAQESRHALAVARTEAKIASLLLALAAGKNQ